MPKRVKGWKILLPVDGSEGAQRAVDAAAQIRWPKGSEFKVISVVERQRVLPRAAAALEDRARSVVEAARGFLEKADWPAASAVLRGAPSQVILEIARRWRADLVILGSRGLGTVRGALLGSVSAAVARAAPCSVLVVRGPLGPPLRAVMAVDGSKHSRLAARRLAALGARGNTVTVVQVITPPRIASLGLLPGKIAGVIRAELKSVTEEMKSDASRTVRAVAKMFREAGWEAESLVRSGDPFAEVTSAAREASITLVGVGPRGVTGIERILLGSVTERLLSAPGVSLFIGR